MIHLKCSIENPFWGDRFESIGWKAGGTPLKHKFWEIQVMKDTELIAVDFRFTTQCDHAGVELLLALFGYSINFHFYDNRHWNYEQGRYYIYGGDEGPI